MDLIDRDEAIDTIESTVRQYHINYFGELSKGAGHYGPTLYKAEDVYEAIKGVPVVDAIPVRHGKWKKIGDSINCSVCKSSSWSVTFEGLVASFNYCPNCGAKMDREQEKQNDS